MLKQIVHIGADAEKPLTIQCPIMISGLSFGAVSKKTKLVIARNSFEIKIGFNSGEGGVLTEN